jgi:hypothetical protein
MAAGANGQQSLHVNGDSHGWDPDLRSAITLQLQQNGGLTRIQSTLRQRLDAAGWSQALKEYCTHLFRSGAATTYDEAWDIVMKRINLNGDLDANDVPNGVPPPDLSIPEDARVDGAAVVKREVRQVLTQK